MKPKLTAKSRLRMSQGGRRASHDAKVKAGQAGYKAMLAKVLERVKQEQEQGKD